MFHLGSAPSALLSAAQVLPKRENWRIQSRLVFCQNAAPNFSPDHTDPAATSVPALWLSPLSLVLPSSSSTSSVCAHFPVSSTLSPPWLKNTQSESMMKITIPNENHQHKTTQGPPNCPYFQLPSLLHMCAVQSLAL